MSWKDVVRITDYCFNTIFVLVEFETGYRSLCTTQNAWVDIVLSKKKAWYVEHLLLKFLKRLANYIFFFLEQPYVSIKFAKLAQRLRLLDQLSFAYGPRPGC